MSGRTAVLIAMGVVVLDRLTKLLVIDGMALGETIRIVPGFFSLTHVHNPGAAFGLLADSPLGSWLLGAVALAAVGGLGWLLVHVPREHRVERAAAAAVIGGALGNLYDRVERGAVIDFLDFYVGRWHWPAFNVADSCITIGVTILVAASFLHRGDAEPAPSRSDASAAPRP